jgi:uncharacterized protein (DUF362 family)
MMAAVKVVRVRGRGVLRPEGDVNPAIVQRMYERGIQLLTGQSSAAAGLSSLFRPSDRVGIKINTIAGRRLTTPPDVALPFSRLLAQSGLPEKNIVIWDRTNDELKEAGYKLHAGSGLRIFGTDAAGAGYTSEPLIHLNIGSLFSTIQSDFVTASVSLAVLKDHGLAGITAGMKNYFGAIHNPNKYHDSNCNPYVAELFDMPVIKTKHRLTILDALVVQYHRGPSYHARWAERYESLIFSLDPVAADFIGWQIIERLRKAQGLPTLAEDNREPLYIRTSSRMGLGRAALNDIQFIEEDV